MSSLPATDAASPSSTVGLENAGSALALDNERWLAALRGSGAPHHAAIAELHEWLLRAARFEAARRRPTMPNLPASEVADLAVQAADDALVAVLARLDSFRGASRFTTWAYKFAIYETSVKLRRRDWQDREVPLEPESWPLLTDSDMGPEHATEYSELLATLGEGIATALTSHQRHVLVALALNGVPIDVLADRLGSTRGALYKTLHDARRKLRGHLATAGLAQSTITFSQEPR